MIFLTNPLHYALHHNLRWQLATRFPFASNQRVIPLARNEVAVTARHLMIAVQTVADRRQVVGLIDRSLYDQPPLAEDGTWKRGPVPTALRYHPFTAIQNGNDPKTSILGVISDPSCLSPDSGEPFFDHLARPLPRVMAVQRRLLQRAGERDQINAAADALEALGALSPLDLSDFKGRRAFSTSNVEILQSIPTQKLAAISERPQDVLLLAAALDVSARLHWSAAKLAAEPKASARPQGVTPAAPAPAPQPSATHDFLVDDEIIMRFES